MRIIRQRRIVEDAWRNLDDNTPLPPEGDVVVSLTRWRRDRAALLAHRGKVGVRLSSDQVSSELVSDLPHWALIELEFADFKDGRHFTNARLLRERWGYTHEIRAVGDVFQDQLALLERCGFDAFALSPESDLDKATRAFDQFSVRYQPALDGPEHVWRQRLVAATPN